MKKVMTVDKYARDEKHWRDRANIAYEAARVLFTHENGIMLSFEAAPVAHHALEMALKTALIREGYTVFNPKWVKFLDPAATLRESDCAWDHNLVALGKMLAAKRLDFDLTAEMLVPFYVNVREQPLTVETALAIFDPFFEELRYPHALEELDGIGPDDIRLLHALFEVLAPFIGNVTAEAKLPSPETPSPVPSSNVA